MERRRVGAEAGKAAWGLVQRYWDGSVTHVEVAIRLNAAGEGQTTFVTRRGFKYQPQFSPDLSVPFISDGPQIEQPFDAASIVRTRALDGPQGYYRVLTVE